MRISYSHRFIFFHVVKTGGISITEALKEYVEEPARFKIRRPPEQIDGRPNRLYDMWSGMVRHASAREAREELSPEVFDGYFKFAFVRNPWDQLVSMYHFMIGQEDHPRRDLVLAMKGFEEYVEWITQTDQPYPSGAKKHQVDTLTDPAGEVLVDFIGRFENLHRDFERVCQRLEIVGVLPHLNRTRHRDYRAYYNGRSRRMVLEHFARDVELLGYSFEGTAETGPIPAR